MKKLTLFLVILLGVSVMSFAQKRDRKPLTPEEMAVRKTDRMKTELGLSEDQYKKVLELNTKVAKERESARKAHREQFKNQQQAMNKDLSGILTKEQMEKHETMKKEMKDKMQSRKGQMRGRGHGGNPVKN